MPDAAVEAARLGLPYTEPVSFGTRTANVRYEWVTDPNDPYAPPRRRRIIEAGAKESMWKRLFGEGGGGGTGMASAPAQAIPMATSATPTPNWWNINWAAEPKSGQWGGQRRLPQPTPGIGPAAPVFAPGTAMLLESEPLPENFDYLHWRERRYWLKKRDHEIKAIAKMRKAAEDQRRAMELDKIFKERMALKQKEKEFKAAEKQLRFLRKDPHRSLPPPTTTQMQMLQQATQPNPKDALSFMVLPTGKESGVRRPFDAPGLPRGLGGPAGQAGWPMMSRTMTHAVTDVSREERVLAIQAGRAWAPNW